MLQHQAIKLIGFMVVLAAVLVLAKPASAQLDNSVSLSISPPHSEITIRPGTSIVQAFNIQNAGTLDLEVTPVLVDFHADPETGAPVLAETSSFPYGTLDNLDKSFGTPFLLSAGQKDQLVVRIAIPEGLEEKDHYQTLLLKTRPSTETMLGGGSNSTALANVGIHILIRVSNTGVDLGILEVSDVRLPKIVDTFSPLKMQVFVRNTGPTFTKTQGEIRIVAPISQDVVKVFPILEQNVLSEGVRKLESSVQDPSDPKSSIPQELEYRPLFLLGPYTVEIDVHAPNQTRSVVSGQVWALPITPAVVIAAFWLIRRIFQRKKKEEFEL